MRRRLLLSNLALVLVVLAVTEIPLAVIYSRREHDALTSSLQRDAVSLAGFSDEIIEHPADHDIGGLAQRFTAGAGTLVVIVDRNGRQLSASPALTDDPAVRAAIEGAQGGASMTGSSNGRAFVAVPVGAGGEHHGAVLVARPTAAIDDRVHQLWLALTGVAVGVLVISVLVSRRLARWALDPLQALDEQAERLGRGELQVRADTNFGPPEIAMLATTFNEMAARLDELVTSQRRFVADASHQLRTPLTALRLRLENLDASDASTLMATREAALQETSRLTRLVDGLLALARSERHRKSREPVDVGAIVEDRRQAWAPLAAERGIALDVIEPHTPTAALAVPGHVEQILDNLIDNAIDVTPRGAAVELSIVRTGSTVELHVVDAGPGMSEDERRRAFDPFWQGSSRHPNGSAGLGLAIVEQLARGSGGGVTLRTSRGGGIDAVVRLDAVPS